MEKKRPFSAIRSHELASGVICVWVSGQVPIDENRNMIGKGNPEAQTVQCYRNIERHLKNVGGTLEDVVKTTIYITNMEHYQAINDARSRLLREPYPTSTLVEVKGLTSPDYLVEIEAEAMVMKMGD